MVLKGNKNWPNPSYNSRISNIVTEFFIPALFESTTYRRIAGLFSSNSFSLCARGISELIANEGNMQLIISPILTKEDAKAIREATQEKIEAILKNSITNELSLPENEFEKDHISALKYLLKNDLLEIRINIPKDEVGNPIDAETIIKKNILAEKRGIFQDRDGNVVSFRGPIDANKDSWEKGIFSITVDVSWDEGQKPHVEDDIRIFEKIWESIDTIKLPEAIKKELIKNAPQKEEVKLEKYNVPPWAILSNGKILWPNQIRAVNAWVNNDYRGIFSIATSGGKTLAAIVAANRLSKDVLVLIIAPGLELSEQWAQEIRQLDSNSEILICNSSYDWKNKLTIKLNKYLKNDNNYKIKNKNYVIVTPDTAITSVFQNNFRYIDEEKLMVVGDEVHHLGAPENQKCLNFIAEYRLGLSATYRRGWDEVGTSAILNYFGRSLSEAGYSVAEGINDGRLSRYSYRPFFTTLEQDEFEEYYNITLEISKLSSREDDESIEQLELDKVRDIKLNLRAEILKKARNKPEAYKEIIRDHPKLPYIVFADDFEQVNGLKLAHKEIIKEMNQTSKIILKDDIFVFSGKTKPWKRKKILEQTVGSKTPIFAMYCLDEGIDVPEFNAAILVSSSRSKRQYIQRRGRILRKAIREEIAQLYDVIVFPPKQNDLRKNQVAIAAIKKEYERVEELSSDATNKFVARQLFDEQRCKLGF